MQNIIHSGSMLLSFLRVSSKFAMPQNVQRILTMALIVTALAPAQAQRKFPEHPVNEVVNEAQNKGKALLVHVAYGFHLPGADMAKRFGWSSTIGGGIDAISKNNYVLGIDGHYMYGQKVNEDPLDPIKTSTGHIIASDQSIASVVLRQRGYYIGGHLGKLFTFNQESRKGIRLTLGAGYLRHKIRVQDDSGKVSELTGDYIKGYDRLCEGLALNQFVGYQLMGKTRSINYFIGFEFNEGFTRNTRDFDFSLKRKLEENRFDFRYGIRLGWSLPFYVKKAEAIYY